MAEDLSETYPVFNYKDVLLWKFEEAIKTYEDYMVGKEMGKVNPQFRLSWIFKIKGVCLSLWPKLLRINSSKKNKDAFDYAFKVANEPDAVSDNDVYFAMIQLSAYFDVAGYTKFEKEIGPIEDIMYKET